MKLPTRIVFFALLLIITIFSTSFVESRRAKRSKNKLKVHISDAEKLKKAVMICCYWRENGVQVEYTAKLNCEKRNSHYLSLKSRDDCEDIRSKVLKRDDKTSVYVSEKIKYAKGNRVQSIV